MGRTRENKSFFYQNQNKIIQNKNHMHKFAFMNFYYESRGLETENNIIHKTHCIKFPSDLVTFAEEILSGQLHF